MADISFDELEIRIVHEGGDIFFMTGREVIEADYFVVVGEEVFH